MTKVVRTLFNDAQNAVDYINALNNPTLYAYMDAGTSYLNINDVFLIQGLIGGTIVYKNGTRISDLSRGYRNPITTIVYSDNFIFIWFYSTWGGGWDTAYGVSYRKLGNLELYSFLEQNGSFNPIENFTFVDEVSGQQYKYNKRLNYSTDANVINYAQNILFESDGTTSADIIEPDILACSVIPVGQIITFGGRNYFSVGNNNIILIEDT